MPNPQKSLIMTKEEKYSIARWAMETALNSGADAVRISISNSNESKVEVRENKIDKLEEANQSSMSISLYVDSRYSSISTNRLTDRKELQRFIAEAIKGTRYLSEDEFRSLPDPSLYYKGEGTDLKTVDREFASLDPQDKIRHAFDVEKEAAGKDERIISVTSNYSDRISSRVMVTSNGFEGDRENSSFALSASVSVKDGEARPRGYWSESSIFHNGLQKEGIGDTALKKALERIGQKKIPSGTMPMIIENRVAPQVLRPLIAAMNGSSIQQKNSFLIGKKGEPVGTDLLDLTDDPFIISGRASRLFDSEGLATRKRIIIEKGVLRDYFIDTYYGKKLEMDPTSGSTTNLVFRPGEKDLAGLLADIDRGIFVTGFNGGNSNGSTGDFSYGIDGFLVEKGVLVSPVSEMNITGNFISLWNNLVAAGSDVFTDSEWLLPSLVFDNISFSGV